MFTRERALLALGGFIQVVLVAANSYCIAQFSVLAAFLTSFGISYVWSRNVKRAAFGDEIDRWFYAGGAAFGCVVGMSLAKLILG